MWSIRDRPVVYVYHNWYMYGYTIRFRHSVIYVCKERKFMETLVNTIEWFVSSHYLIIGILAVVGIITYIESEKAGNNNG